MAEDKGKALRDALDRAITRDRTKDAIAALQGLAQLEQDEPRWSQRLGDFLHKAGRDAEAEAAWMRCMDVLVRQGFLPRALAIAKLIVSVNPKRIDILSSIDQQAAKALRGASGLVPPPARPTAVVATAPSVAPPLVPQRPSPQVVIVRQPEAVVEASLPEPVIEKGMREPAEEPAPLSIVAGPSVPTAVSSARGLERARDASDDETRFDDLDVADMDWVDASDMEAISVVQMPAVAPKLPPPNPTAAWVSKLSATALLADIPQMALAELAVAAKRIDRKDDELVVKKGARADSLYIIAEGAVRVSLPAHETGGVDLAAGQVFGEACLLASGKRQADVRARGNTVLLQINVADLNRIIPKWPELSNLLFGLLIGRLVANLLQTSSMFSAFDMDQRRQIARMFEVRRAAPRTVLQKTGKRCDALYIPLMGEFDIEEGGLVATLAPGTIFGHESLLTRQPAERTIKACSDAVVLRMPAARFTAFASQFPPALEHLADLASRPVSLWPGD